MNPFDPSQFNPATGEPFNRARAETARGALDEFTAWMFERSIDELLADGPDGDALDAFADLITNTLHLAQFSGLDTETITRRALANFIAESRMEGVQIAMESPAVKIAAVLATVNENSEPDAMAEALAAIGEAIR